MSCQPAHRQAAAARAQAPAHAAAAAARRHPPYPAAHAAFAAAAAPPLPAAARWHARGRETLRLAIVVALNFHRESSPSWGDAKNICRDSKQLGKKCTEKNFFCNLFLGRTGES